MSEDRDEEQWVNPYELPGRGGVPRILERDMPTVQELSRILRQTLFYRHMGVEELSERSAVGLEAANELVYHGRGTVSDLMATLSVLGIDPVRLPPLGSLKVGF